MAAAAGVSIAAVSKVLHGRGGTIRVSEATANRIRDAAVRLEYRPNYHARSLRSGRSYTVGLATPTRPRLRSRGVYFAVVLEALMDELHARGYSLMLSPEILPIGPGAVLTDGKYDGVIWLDADPTEETIRRTSEGKVPSVGINSGDLPTPPPAGVFASDEAGGMALALDHLTRLGHRRLLYLDGGEGDLPIAHRRATHFCAMAKERKLDAHIETWDAHRSLDGATAILAWSLPVAAEVVSLMKSERRRIPEDLSVVAFDGAFLGPGLQPEVTNLAVPLAEISRAAASSLIATIEGGPLEEPRKFLPTLDDRGTTGPVAA